MAVYLMCIHGNSETRQWFEAAIRVRGKKLDMGQCCVRFKKLEDLPLDVIGKAIARVPVARYVASYEAARQQVKRRKKKQIHRQHERILVHSP